MRPRLVVDDYLSGEHPQGRSRAPLGKTNIMLDGPSRSATTCANQNGAYATGATASVSNPFKDALHVSKTQFLLLQLASAFRVIPSDDRELWVKLGHAVKTLDEDGGDEGKNAWLEWSSKSEKFDPADAERVWDSLSPTSTSHEQVFRTAEEYGWDVQAENARIGFMLEQEPERTQSTTTDRARAQLGSPSLGSSLRSLNVSTYGQDLLREVAVMSRRDWIIHRLLLVGYISLILGPGGVSKSMLQLIGAISAATGRDLLGLGPVRQSNVLLINNEDDETELKRRIAAVLVKFEINPAELEGTLFTISGYTQPVRFAYLTDKSVSRSPVIDQVEALVRGQRIGSLFVDPFITTHTAPENDNNAMDQVVAIYKKLAGQLGVAVNIVHHTRKIGGDPEAHAGDAESGRGASSIKDASRAAVTIARMSQKTAEKLSITDEERGSYIRMDVGKMNFAAHDSKANWYRIEQVTLANGDTVGVPKPVNLDQLFLRAADDRKKWTANSVAVAVSSLFPTNKTQVQWSDIKVRFMEQHAVGKSAAGEYITLLPQEEEAACRVGHYDVWITRSAPRNGWMLHRKGVRNV